MLTHIAAIWILLILASLASTTTSQPSAGMSAVATASYPSTSSSKNHSLPVSSRSLCGQNNALAAKCFANSIKYAKARAVAHLIVPGGLCTGVLVGADGHLLTAAHCISSEAAAASTIMYFLFESPGCDTRCQGTPNDPQCLPAVESVTASIAAASDMFDWVLLKLSANLATKYGYLKLRASGAIDTEPVYVPQHMRGMAKTISAQNDDGDVRVFSFPVPTISSDGQQSTSFELIAHNGDTLQGASGAPVIANLDNRIIALHAQGAQADSCMNIGTNSSSIVAELVRKGIVPRDMW